MFRRGHPRSSVPLLFRALKLTFLRDFFSFFSSKLRWIKCPCETSHQCPHFRHVFPAMKYQQITSGSLVSYIEWSMAEVGVSESETNWQPLTLSYWFVVCKGTNFIAGDYEHVLSKGFQIFTPYFDIPTYNTTSLFTNDLFFYSHVLNYLGSREPCLSSWSRKAPMVRLEILSEGVQLVSNIKIRSISMLRLDVCARY